MRVNECLLIYERVDFTKLRFNFDFSEHEVQVIVTTRNGVKIDYK